MLPSVPTWDGEDVRTIGMYHSALYDKQSEIVPTSRCYDVGNECGGS
jgi:hypothetical protein